MFPWAFQYDNCLHKERFNLDKSGRGINLLLICSLIPRDMM